MKEKMKPTESITKIASEYGGQLRVKSALNPILWLCGIIGTPCILSITWQKEPSWVLISLLFMVVLTAIGSFIYFVIVDPDRLQSEEYQLRRKTLELIEESGDLNAIDARLVDVISEPKRIKIATDINEMGDSK
jgi:hypothetical protein